MSQPQETRSKRLREKNGSAMLTTDNDGGEGDIHNKRTRTANKEDTPRARWKAHQMAQDYVDLASHMMLYPLSKLGPYGYAVVGHVAAGCDGLQQQQQVRRKQQLPQLSSYPLEHMSVLGYLKSAVRRPTVIERWSPYEIAVFEAALAEYGKDFSKVRKEIGSTKTTQDVIEFYYIWKKTSHYAKWKLEYVPEYLDVLENTERDAKLCPKR